MRARLLQMRSMGQPILTSTKSALIFSSSSCAVCAMTSGYPPHTCAFAHTL